MKYVIYGNNITAQLFLRKNNIKSDFFIDRNILTKKTFYKNIKLPIKGVEVAKKKNKKIIICTTSPTDIFYLLQEKKLIYNKNFFLFSKFDKNKSIIDILNFEEDFLVSKKLIQLIKKPCVFDVGAHTGTFSIFIKHSIKNSKIFLFEPQKELLFFQKEFFKHYKLKNKVIFKNYALLNKKKYLLVKQINDRTSYGQSTFEDSKNNFFYNMKNKIMKTANVKMKKIKVTIKNKIDFKIQQLDFIKIDTENSEINVLKCLKKEIELFKPIIYLEKTGHYNQIKKKYLNTVIQKNNYVMFKYKKNFFYEVCTKNINNHFSSRPFHYYLINKDFISINKIFFKKNIKVN